ncbi:TrmB family transcriptional regulator [Patescibacteria group bacterium]
MAESTLKEIGFKADEIKIYLNLLENSPTSVRTIARRTGIGRGTVFNVLKKFVTEGVAQYHQRGRIKMFAAQDPKTITSMIQRRKRNLDEQKKKAEQIIPELRSLYTGNGHKPKVSYFEGTSEVSGILHDVLDVVSHERNKEYYVYSTKGKRQIIYADFPEFSEKRIAAGIKVKVIAIGQGGELRGLDERKWLVEKDGEDPCYMVIYGNKIAYVTLDIKSDPVGVIIEDQASAQTQKLIFKKLWESLPPDKSSL